MKLVVNKCYGGFGLSEAAVERYATLKGLTLYPENGKFSALAGPTWWTVPPEGRLIPLDGEDWKRATMAERQENNRLYSEQTLSPSEIARDDAFLVQVVEEMGDEASGRFAKLKVVEIPDGVEWEIQEYDGQEWVAEKHRTW